MCFLASDLAGYITGALIDVSGGKFATQIPRLAWESAAAAGDVTARVAPALTASETVGPRGRLPQMACVTDHHLMYGRCIRREVPMRTTFNLDDDLLGEAQRLTGMTERTALIHEGLRALI